MRSKGATMQKKLTIAVCLIVSVAFLLCAIISYVNFTCNKMQDAQKYLDAVVGNVRDDLDRLVDDMDRLTTMPYYSGIVDVISKYAGQPPGFFSNSDRKLVARQLLYIAEMKDIVSTTYIPLVNGQIFTMNRQNESTRWSMKDLPWLAGCDEEGALSLLPYHDARYVDGGRRTVSFARVLKDTANMRNVAYIVIELGTDRFQMCVPDTARYGEKIYVLSASGGILYPYPENRTQQELLKDYYMLYRDRHLISSARTHGMGLTVVGALTEDQYIDSRYSLIYTLLITYLCTLTCSILMIILITRTFVKPLRALRAVVQRLTQRDFDVHLDVRTNDEVGELAEGFNSMAAEIRRLLDEIQSANEKERRILYSLLQAQIGPHFIYNSLEAMSRIALSEGKYELSDGIVALSRLMRHVSDKDEDVVYLSDELRIVEDYIRVQTLASGMRVELGQDVDIAHEYLLVPKLVLQPLVENVYRHNASAKQLMIHIRSELAEGHLMLTIADNGKGSTASRLEQIRKRIEDESQAPPAQGERHHGYALRNIHMRIVLLYGQGFGLSFPRQPRRGFVAQLCLPVLWEKGGGVYENPDR